MADQTTRIFNGAKPVFVIASKNRHKVGEITSILQGCGLDLKSLEEYPNLNLPEETGETFKDNALIKARFVLAQTGISALGDDSGLEVDALNGQPGVRSSRFAGDGASYEENTKKLLSLLADLPHGRLTARFVCVLAVCFSNGVEMTFRGTCEGEIIGSPTGKGGFGYDPVFFIPEKGKTMAELEPGEKNMISHRGKAFRAFGEWVGGDRRV